MGRYFEALKQANQRGPAPVAAAPAPATNPVRVEPTSAPAEEEIPYIEVGGGLEGSKSVLAAPVPVRFHAQPAEKKDVSKQESADLVFRPLDSAPPPWAPPEQRFARHLVTFHQPQHPAAEQYRALWGNVTAPLATGTPQILLFTGSRDGAGVTTILLNLAIVCARQGKSRVLVVDANLLRPAVAARLGVLRGPGLCEVLAGAVSYPRALQETGQEFLLALTAGKAPEEDAGLLAGDLMALLLARLRKRFDYVLVDAPPWDNGPEVGRLASACDAIYLVLRESEAAAPENDALLKNIQHQGHRLRGCVVAKW